MSWENPNTLRVSVRRFPSPMSGPCLRAALRRGANRHGGRVSTHSGYSRRVENGSAPN
jgi:hypothetical protein